jgi:hypothetical protein
MQDPEQTPIGMVPGRYLFTWFVSRRILVEGKYPDQVIWAHWRRTMPKAAGRTRKVLASKVRVDAGSRLE